MAPRALKKHLLVLLLATAPAALAACSSDDSGGNGGGGQTTACSADVRKDVYAAGLTKPAGALKVKLVEAKPGPMVKGTNEMTIELMDAAGAPFEATVDVVKPFMPDHGHASAVKPTVKALGGGKYAVSDIYLAMAGLWKITVTVQMPNGSGVQEANFNFCLDG
jgi:hypothetical protein